jgi:hypothetical protein
MLLKRKASLRFQTFPFFTWEISFYSTLVPKELRGFFQSLIVGHSTKVDRNNNSTQLLLRLMLIYFVFLFNLIENHSGEQRDILYSKMRKVCFLC